MPRRYSSVDNASRCKVARRWVQVGLNRSRCRGPAAARTLVRGSLIARLVRFPSARRFTIELGPKQPHFSVKTGRYSQTPHNLLWSLFTRVSTTCGVTSRSTARYIGVSENRVNTFHVKMRINTAPKTYLCHNTPIFDTDLSQNNNSHPRIHTKSHFAGVI